MTSRARVRFDTFMAQAKLSIHPLPVDWYRFALPKAGLGLVILAYSSFNNELFAFRRLACVNSYHWFNVEFRNAV